MLVFEDIHSTSTTKTAEPQQPQRQQQQQQQQHNSNNNRHLVRLTPGMNPNGDSHQRGLLTPPCEGEFRPSQTIQHLPIPAVPPYSVRTLHIHGGPSWEDAYGTWPYPRVVFCLTVIYLIPNTRCIQPKCKGMTEILHTTDIQLESEHTSWGTRPSP